MASCGVGQARRRVAVVDAGEPRNAPAVHMHGFLSRDSMPPVDLLTAGSTEVSAYGVAPTEDQVVGLDVRPVPSRCLRARRTGAGSA